MALRVCLDCTTRFAVGLEACPHCQSTDHEEAGTMPKITRHGGPTIAGASVVAGAWTDSGSQDEWPDLTEPAAEEKEVPSSPGSSSLTSPEKPQTPPGQSRQPRQSPARTTGNRSAKARTGNRTARGTGGGRTAHTPDADDS